MWNIEKEVKQDDYFYALVPAHPFATKNGYVLYHRIVMENYLGRILKKDEVVHHKDGDKRNNKIENLEVMKAKAHSRLHSSMRGKWYAKLKCPECGKIFEKLNSHTHIDRKEGGKYTACSRRCNGKISRRIYNGEDLSKQFKKNYIEKFKKYLVKPLRAEI